MLVRVCTISDVNQEDVGPALVDIGIEASNLRTVPVEGAPEVVMAFDVEPESWLATWRTLRDQVGELGLWPLATCTWGEPLDEINRWGMQGPDGLDVTPAAILGRVPEVDVDRLLDLHRQHQRDEWLPDDDYLAFVLEDAAIDGVDLEQLHGELGLSPDVLDVERWLLDIELARGIRPDPGHNDWYLNWYEPEAVVMLLLPTTAAWECGAFVGGWAWGYPHTDLRTALLRRWHDRHGAELAANWGTMLQFVVAHPAATIEEAWTLAYEISLLWPDTAGGGNGVATRRHARDLIGRRDWFLHYRP